MQCFICEKKLITITRLFGDLYQCCDYEMYFDGKNNPIFGFIKLKNKHSTSNSNKDKYIALNHFGIVMDYYTQQHLFNFNKDFDNPKEAYDCLKKYIDNRIFE